MLITVNYCNTNCIIKAIILIFLLFQNKKLEKPHKIEFIRLLKLDQVIKQLHCFGYLLCSQTFS